MQKKILMRQIKRELEVGKSQFVKNDRIIEILKVKGEKKEEGRKEGGNRERKVQYMIFMIEEKIYFFRFCCF